MGGAPRLSLTVVIDTTALVEQHGDGAVAGLARAVNATSLDVLSDAFGGVNVTRTAGVTVEEVTQQVDVSCPKGHWCSAANIVPCPAGTWNNETNQIDAGACRRCPYFSDSPEALAVLRGGASAIRKPHSSCTLAKTWDLN